MVHICIWADGTWCDYDDRGEMTHMSDDFTTIQTNASNDPDEVAQHFIKHGLAGINNLLIIEDFDNHG